VKSVREQHRKVIGIDMEAYAIFAAANDARKPQPSPIVLKSVADYADEGKRDDYHAFAAYTSSRALRLLIEEYVLGGSSRQR
jgi:nucleoside phosphorylase